MYNLAVIQSLLKKISQAPLSGIPLDLLERLYNMLLGLQLENEKDFSQEFKRLLVHVLDLLDQEMVNRKQSLDLLTHQLIANPAVVEFSIMQMSLFEVLEALKRRSEIQSPELRQQFANMLDRRLVELSSLTMPAN